MAIPRTRPSAYPAVLSYGFRPFFLLGSLYAGAAILFWLPLIVGSIAFVSLRKGLNDPDRPDLCVVPAAS